MAVLPTIFLSYGRADAADLAERLHDSLTAAGFHVWQDRRKIRIGANWDQEIEEGLRSSKVLLSLLSPHAVRRARDGHPSGDDSVCLDEIAYARGVCRIPIVPIRVAPCTTPLLIYRLQAVDMMEWLDSEANYETAFQLITTYIHDVLAGETKERTWTGALTGWDFGPFLTEKRRAFSGRTWLFEAIDEWRRRPAGGALLIAGDPGIGKSAIVAELVATNPGGQVLAYHCCQADTPATLDPARFVRSLAAMLAARLPAYAEILDQPDVQEQLSESRLAADPSSTFESAILAPLHRLGAGAVPEAGNDACVYVLVDALDEALTRPSPTILDVLASRLQRLPSWVRIVATTRNDRRVLQRLAGLPAETLSAGDARNVADVRRHIEARLADPGLRAALHSAGFDAQRVAEDLTAASGGNFLFATKALEAVESGQLTFAQMRSLPPGLGSLYQLFFSRILPERDASTKASRKLLQVIVAARESLTRTQLGAATGIDREDELPDLLSRLSAFTPQRDGHYALFHRSLQEWLTGWDQALDIPVAGPYFANPKKGHALLAAWAWSDYKRGVSACGPYTLRHLPAHLAAAGRVDDLVTLLTDWRYLEAKAEGLGNSAATVFDLVNDFAAALDIVAEDHPRRFILALLHEAIRFDTSLIARHPQSLFQCCWNRCWWYDAPAAAHFFEDGSDDPVSPSPPWRRAGEKLHTLLETWRTEKEKETEKARREFVWLRALRPPADSIGGPQRAVLQAHLKGSIHLSLSPDEKRLVSGGEWGSIRLWDLQSGATIAVFDRPDSVGGVAFLPRTDWLAAIVGHALLFLTADTLALDAELEVSGEHLTALSVSSDGRRLAIGQFDGMMRLIDANTRKELDSSVGHKESVNSLAFSPDGQSLASAGAADDHSVCVWSIADDQLKEQIRFDCEKSVEAVAFSSDGGLLVWSDYGGRFTCLDLRSGERWSAQLTPSSETPANCLAFAPDGRMVFFGSGAALGADSEAEVGILDLSTRIVVRRLHGHSSMVLDLVVLSDGRSVISAAHDSTIRLWSLDKVHEYPELPWWERQIEEAAFSPDGVWIYTAPKRGTFVSVRNVESGEFVGTLSDLESGVEKLAPSPDGKRVAVVDRQGNLRVLWTVEENPDVECPTGSGIVRELRFSPDSRLVGMVSYGDVLCVVDASTGKKCVDVSREGEASDLKRVFFSKDSRLVAGIGFKRLVVAETATGKIVARHGGEALLSGSACGFADNGQSVVFEGRLHATFAIDLGTGRLLDVTPAHQSALDEARDDAPSPFGWGIGAPEAPRDLPESEMPMEMSLGEKRREAAIAWIPLPWTHDIWHHPSGRVWALQRYGQLHVLALERHPGRNAS